MSESLDPAAERRADTAADTPAVEPVHVLGPYIGVSGAVLCVLVGGFLLLAPYAFDYRAGAPAAPRSTVVDLTTGGAMALLGLLTAALFGANLVRRLRVWPPEPDCDEDLHAQAAEPEPQPAASAAVTGDPGGALRDLLTPLVAALAADLRARESGGGTEGKAL